MLFACDGLAEYGKCVSDAGCCAYEAVMNGEKETVKDGLEEAVKNCKHVGRDIANPCK